MRHKHQWSPRHKRYGLELWLRACLVEGCGAITDEKKILFKDGRIVRLSSTIRRQFEARLSLQKGEVKA